MTVRASQAGNANYNDAMPVDRPFTVSKANQTITFDLPHYKILGAAPFDISATGGGSGNPVTFQFLSGGDIASIDGSTITLTPNKLGEVLIRASQAGNDNYNAAQHVDQFFTVVRFTKLADFTGSAGDAPGSTPFGSLTLGADGNLYGLTDLGGANSKGTAFRMTPDGTFTKLLDFNGSNGANPDGRLTQDAAGDFWCMTSAGGTGGFGTIFRMTSEGVLATLVSFDDADKGKFPRGSLVDGGDGNFYGLTSAGGANGGGTAFRVASDGTFEKLADFASGASPRGDFLKHTDGHFYGTTSGGGDNSLGSLFRLEPNAVEGMRLTILASFDGGGLGKEPFGSLIDQGAGDLIGVTQRGGANDKGAVFKFNVTGGVMNKLADFDGTGNGASPTGDFLDASDVGYGNSERFYGLASAGGDNALGVIFKMKSDGKPRKLWDFSTADGSQPFGSLVQGYDGALYGMTSAAGATDDGSIFKLEAGLPAIDEPPTVMAPASFDFTEDMQGNLHFTGTPFADPDDMSLTVTLSIGDGMIDATTGDGVTVGGTAAARTFAGTTAALNTFFTAEPAKIAYTPAANTHGSRTITTTVMGDILSASATSGIAIAPVGDTPAISGAVNTLEDTVSELITIDRNAADGPEVSHFKFSGFMNGSLFRNNGTTEIMDGDFLAVAEVGDGVKFLPGMDFGGQAASFDAEPSLDGATVPLGGTAKATAYITVTSVNDPPAFTLGGDDLSDGKVVVMEDFTGMKTVTVTAGPVPADEMGEMVTYRLLPVPAGVTPNVAIVSVDSMTGEVTLTAIDDAFGSQTITVEAVDNGMPAPATYRQSFTLEVTPVNDPPSFELGNRWVENTTATSRKWVALAGSAGGSRLIAAAASSGVGHLYTSEDAGKTWTQRISDEVHQNGSWNAVASSADGLKLVAAGNGDEGKIYTSTDGGENWTEQPIDDPAAENWTDLASSADGSKLVALGGSVFTSTDFGITWTKQTGSPSVTTVASSADGSKLIAGEHASQTPIYTSNDSGQTWVETSSGDHGWKGVASSADGSKLAAVSNDGSVSTSADSGATWTARNFSSDSSWSDVASSADGTRLVAVDASFDFEMAGHVHVSIDSGQTWAMQTGPGQRAWNAVVSSADGNRFAAVVYEGFIYTLDNTFPNTGPQTVSGFAGNISKGPDNESGQTLDFLVMNDNPDLFDVAPDIDPATGNLTFTPKAGAGGVVNLTIMLTDQAGGMQTTAEQTFSFTLLDAPDVTAPASFPVTEDEPGNLQYTGMPFSDADSPWLTATLSISDGSIDADSADGVTVGGTAVARTFFGTPAALNDFFAAGKITYTTALNNNASRMLTTTVTDGEFSAMDTITIDVTPVNDPPNFTLATSCTTRESNRAWDSVSSSADGSKLVAVVRGGRIYTSSDSGKNWTARMTDMNRDWESVASSENGSKLAAVVYGGQIYISTDSGETRRARMIDMNRNWTSVASSADGAKLVAVIDAGNIYTSTNSGETWTARMTDMNRPWFSVASSADGSKLVAADVRTFTGQDFEGGHIYTSINSGETWMPRMTDKNRFWWSVASSADGSKLVAVDRGGYIYTSTDSGATWMEQTSAGMQEWYSVASSADGANLVAVVRLFAKSLCGKSEVLTCTKFVAV